MNGLVVAGLAVMYAPVTFGAFTPIAPQNVGGLMGGEGSVGNAAVPAMCEGNAGAAQDACESAGGTWHEAVPAISGTSNTGVYEITANVVTGLQVAMGVVVAFVGYGIIRTLIKKVRGR